MTREEAEEYAKEMTYRDAINNLMQARSIPYRKATFIKFNELLKALEQEPCKDCISRKALLNKIKEVCFSREQKWVNFRVSQGSNGQRDFLINYIKQLPSVKPQEPKWIFVSERLPYKHEYIKNNGLFNVTDGNRTYSEWFDIYDTQKFGEPTINGFRVDHAVIAWMPLETYEPQERSE